MFVGHLPALFALLRVTSPSDLDLVRLLLLMVTQAFFILKLVDVSWLRLPSERRALISFCLISLLLHAGVAHRLVTDGDALAIEPWQAIVLAGGCVHLLAEVRPGLLPGNRAWSRSSRVQQRASLQQAIERLTCAVLPPRFQLLIRACAVDRAPPAPPRRF